MTDSIDAVVAEMETPVPITAYPTRVHFWAKRLAALSPAGSGLTANSKPVAWLLIHSTQGFRKIVISEKTADSWHGWNKHPLYTTPPPAVDVGKLRELQKSWRRHGTGTATELLTLRRCADELEYALNAAGAKD